MKNLISLLLLFFALQSCENKIKKTDEINPKLVNGTEVNTIPTDFESLLRPNKKLKLGKIYTDTLKYVTFDDNRDNWLVFVKKNNDTIGLVYNKDETFFKSGDEIMIQWKMDSVRNAGDPEFLDYREILIKIQKTKRNITARNFKNIENKSFVISCGTGCAMTHNIKKITQINSTTVQVVFEIEQYVDQEMIKTFDETYIFINDQNNTIELVTDNGKNENIKEMFFGGALETFQDFGKQIMQ
ncbi:hypothetical protein HNQ02_000474 [Flavobacterium sp. 7E]|uniref:hypothetical protein n=1 Tax=Flavobacterium sp. 7E TaxID=2735898 RepID=UPI001570C04D|nr:hypothetical protein [Flavobacterium sp. 7E]NRS87567.1 hypothetical protein [Flavobacterium sp. 7E]